MDPAPPHTRLPFPFSVGFPVNEYVSRLDFHNPRIGALLVIGASVLVSLLSLAVWLFMHPNWAERVPWLRRLHSGLLALQSALVILQVVDVVGYLRRVVAALVDSGFAKLHTTVQGLGDSLEFFGTWGAFALASVVVAVFLSYAARTRRIVSHPSPTTRRYQLPSHLLVAALSSTCMLSAIVIFGAALRSYLPYETPYKYVYLNAYDPKNVSDYRISALTQAYYLALGLVFVAALGFWVAERMRPRLTVPSRLRRWTLRVYAGVSALLAIVLTAFTQPLAAEHGCSIPLDHAFANLTLSIPPPLPHLQGIGPDAAYYGGGYTMRLGLHEAGREILPEASNPSELRRLMSNQYQSWRYSPTRQTSERKGFDVSIDDKLNPEQIREWLAAMNSSDPAASHLGLAMSDVLRLSRPVLGQIAGVKWTAARFEVRANAKECEQVRGPALDLTWPSDETSASIQSRIVQARREQQTACLVVGNMACREADSPEHDCWNRLGSPLRVLKTPPPEDGLRALRVAIDQSEFDVVEVEDPDQIRFFAQGPQTLADVRSRLERQRCSVPLLMNGGMYEPNYSPVGLFISDFTVVEPLNERDAPGNFYLKPNGVFSVGSMGARITSDLESHQLFAGLRAATVADRGEARNATQSGPMILVAGREHPAFDAKSDHRAIRNAVGVKKTDDSHTRVLFAISNTPVTFHELAQLFTHFAYLDALYLDGRVSRMDLPALGRIVDDRKLGPVLAVANCPDG